MSEPKYKFTYLTGHITIKPPQYRIEPRLDGFWITSDAGIGLGPFASSAMATRAIRECGGQHQPNEGEG